MDLIIKILQQIIFLRNIKNFSGQQALPGEANIYIRIIVLDVWIV